MIELILELILDLLTDVIFQGVIQVLPEFGAESVAKAFEVRREAGRLLAVCGLALLGGLVGLGWSLVMPYRVFHVPRLPGVSLVLAPLGVGALMHGFGRLRRRWGGNPTYMASFWGGGAFAFATALVRWLMVGHV